MKLLVCRGRLCEVKSAEETKREDLFFDPEAETGLAQMLSPWLLLEICILSISVYQTWNNSEIWMAAKHSTFLFEAV